MARSTRALEALEESIRLAAQGNPSLRNLVSRHAPAGCMESLGAAELAWIYIGRIACQTRIFPSPMRNGTLVSYALFEIASGQLDTAAATLANCKPDAPPWESMLRLAKCRLALARADFSEGIALADAAIEFTREYKLDRYLPEASISKRKSHFLQGDLQTAKVALEQARLEAENLGSVGCCGKLSPPWPSSSPIKDCPWS